MGAFHAYDIRGVWNKDFNSDTVYRVGFFLPELLNTRSILVGRDDRSSSPEIREALVRGITDAGADVYDIGLSTTPMVYFTTAHRGFKASVQITASHNPAEYNGLKVSRENALPVGYDTGLGQLEEWILNGRPTTPHAQLPGKVIHLDVYEEYLTFQRRYLGDISNLKIAMDLSNGMASLFADALFGDHPLYLYKELDGRFPNHEPNPLVPENTRDLRKRVQEEKCDIGVIYDGDADRVMFVDENGRFISPDLIIALLGDFFIQGKGTSAAARKQAAQRPQPPVRVLQDIRSSKAVSEYLQPYGAEVHTWKVGRAFAALKLRQMDGLFGGELAGHYYFKDFFYSDSGIMASLIVLDLVAAAKREGKTFSQLVGAIERYENSGEINFRLERKQEAMEAVKAHFIAKETPTREMDFDGYRVEFPHWWFNIRPSNTEPYLRFICEADNHQLLEHIIEETRTIINNL